MSTLAKENLEAAIAGYLDPNIASSLLKSKSLKDIRIDGNKAEVDIVLGYPADLFRVQLEADLQQRVKEVEGLDSCTFNISSKIIAHTVQHGVKRMNNIKNIIAVASGKGGVGKSTTSVNIALALASEGAVVGLLDADIYGPSQPRMMGLSGQPESKDGKSLEPMENYGVQTMSIGFLVDEESPMIWRGPMVTQALEQLLNDTNWRDLDYLIIDLPPGTGDTQLTLAQKVPLSGAIIVTTPQDIALLDARKGLKMFEKSRCRF
jgi:ATP-binding protein involved in chromosome partitioning